jgi:cytochrome c553
MIVSLSNGARQLGGLMQAVVAQLTEDDMIAIAAYLGSLEP